MSQKHHATKAKRLFRGGRGRRSHTNRCDASPMRAKGGFIAAINLGQSACKTS